MAALAVAVGVDCPGTEALMATLILSAIGNQLGGPIGSAIGAIIGQRIDSKIFAPKGRKGPRLNELAVQSSSYGSPIPKLFGTNRVAGSVIWSTDLKEMTRKVSNGKGQPKSTVYSYSASFAVALSGRRILHVERIWADGNLLRGAAGDFKTETGFRLHTGAEDQAVDPLIASAEGIGTTPAYRGMAYAVFEDFQLGDYGNRIPSLSFEVVADEGGAALGNMIEELAQGGIDADWPPSVGGIAVTGDSLRGLIETLTPLYPVFAHQGGARIKLRAALETTLPPAPRDLGARVEIERGGGHAIPSSVAVSYYETERDYQPGLQRARGFGSERRELRVELPVTLDAASAKGLVSAAARRAWRERSTARIRLPWRALGLSTGQVTTLPLDDRQWRVAIVAFEEMAVVADLVAFAPIAASQPPSDAGEGVLQPDLIHGPTVLHVLDLPPPDDRVAMAPRIAVAAAGASSGWRRASLLVSLDGGTSWQEVGGTAAPATMGSALTMLQPGSAHIRDDINSVDVELLNTAMTLNDASDEVLLTGANAAMLGSEIIQFASAQPLAPARYRLSGLLRGRRATEWAMSTHGPSERFVLLQGETLAAIDVPTGAGQIKVMATSVGDAVPPVQTMTITGEAVIPTTIASLRAERLFNGDTALRWIRRSRNGWQWLNGADAPLVEELERYRVELAPNAGAARIVERSSPDHLYPAGDRAADISAGATAMTATVTQLGTFGASRAVSITFSLT